MPCFCMQDSNSYLMVGCVAPDSSTQPDKRSFFCLLKPCSHDPSCEVDGCALNCVAHFGMVELGYLLDHNYVGVAMLLLLF
eukprot:m.49378 g.49378  ORF g.49378 m.49378 type:complete len:81 (+) comp11090_c0_seq1:1777-2019(+)